MAKDNTFHCTVVTPERSVLDCDARFVAFPAHDGEMGALHRRAPLVCKLGIGPLRVETPETTHSMYVEGGFAQVVGDRLTLLTQHTGTPDDVDVAAATQSLVEARAMPITDEASYTARDNAIRLAQVQLKLGRQ